MVRALVVICLLATSASAEAWHEGEHGGNRVLHVSLTAVGFVSYPLLKGVEGDLAADACRWCDPTGLDAGVRDRLRWRDIATAGSLSDLTSYGIAPLASSLVGLGTLADGPTWARVIDDATPIVETIVITQWLTRGIKLAAGRQRPYAHYTAAVGDEDNMSFISGHASRAFAVVVSAGTVARARGYRSEPWIWTIGLTAAAASAYFRIAADQHYLTDVLAGAALGTAAGLTVPLLMRRNGPQVTVTSRGVALAGAW